MEFSEMVAIRRKMLQGKIDSKTELLNSMAEPITAVLKAYKIRFKTRTSCRDTRVPYEITIDTKRPEIRIEVVESGYTLYDSHTTPWSFLHMREIDLELAMEHLAALVAKSQVRTPC